MTDIRHSIQYANYLKQTGWLVERKAEVNYFIKRFPIAGSVIKIQRPEEIHNKSINQLANKYRAFQIIIEPKDMVNGQWLMANGFKPSKHPYLPTKTLRLDLTTSENKLIAQMKKDARAALRTTKNLKLITNNGAENFRNQWKKAVGWKRYVPPLPHLMALKKSFKKSCLFLSCINASKVNAGAIFLLADNIAYYWQAFTNAEGRKSMAQYRVVWEGIKWAKKRGAKVFDFEGIYDERFPNKSWLGFTHFKRSFGGYEVEYPGCFTKSMLPF